MDQVELACPFCAGQFQAEAASQSRATTCPNCGRMVTVPAVTSHVPPPPLIEQVREGEAPAEPMTTSGTGSADFGELSRAGASPSQQQADDAPAEPRSPFDLVEPTKTIVNRRGEEVPLRRLSPGERERYRRRLNVVFAAIGMAILAIALVVLLRVRP